MSSYFRNLSTYLGVLVFLVVQQGPVVLLDHHSSLIESSVCSYCTLKLHITLRIVTSINIMPGNMYVGHCVIIKDVVYRQISSIRSFVLVDIKVQSTYQWRYYLWAYFSAFGVFVHDIIGCFLHCVHTKLFIYNGYIIEYLTSEYP